MKKRISILGSTGSIGMQTLDVARNLNINVIGLSANKNIDLLEKQIREFKPKAVSVSSSENKENLKSRIEDLKTEVYFGQEGLVKIATLEENEMVINSIVGIAGLIPTIEAIRSKKDIALANKESLVAAGNLIMAEARKHNVDIIPIDSEHSAIYQCIAGNIKTDIAKIILTASGGPFRGLKYRDLVNVTPEEALLHPNWKMGDKISIDCATLMNKGFEVIEARWLFDVSADNIMILIHPQSIVHSMVEYDDGSIIAQLGPPDMRIPIQYALTCPERKTNNFSRLDLFKDRKLTFENLDNNAFPFPSLAYRALKVSGTMPAVMNGADEMAVQLFLSKKIAFTNIFDLIKQVMDSHKVMDNPSINDIIEADQWAKNEVYKICNKRELFE